MCMASCTCRAIGRNFLRSWKNPCRESHWTLKIFGSLAAPVAPLPKFIWTIARTMTPSTIFFQTLRSFFFIGVHPLNQRFIKGLQKVFTWFIIYSGNYENRPSRIQAQTKTPEESAVTDLRGLRYVSAVFAQSLSSNRNLSNSYKIRAMTFRTILFIKFFHSSIACPPFPELWVRGRITTKIFYSKFSGLSKACKKFSWLI